MKNIYFAEGFLPSDGYFGEPKTGENNKYSMKVMFTVPVVTQEAYGENPAKTSFNNTFVVYAGSEKQANYYKEVLKKGNFVSCSGKYTGSSISTTEQGEQRVTNFFQIERGNDLTIIPYTKKNNNQNTAPTQNTQNTAPTQNTQNTAPTPTENEVKQQVQETPVDSGLPWA